MKKFNVGLQLYSVRESMKQDFYGTLKAVRDMGYTYVEFAGYFGKSAEEIKAALDELGLKCISVHQGLDGYEPDPAALVKFLKTFGVKYSVIPWYKKEELASAEAWEKTSRKFNEMAEYLSANEMMLGYHNHDFEFERRDGKFLYDYIFESVPEDKIVPEIDTCWVRYAGLKPEEKIMEYSGRVEIVHLKDFKCRRLAAGPAYDLIGADAVPEKREDNEFEFRPLGCGMQDFDAILAACEAAGCETVIVEQDQPSMGMSDIDCVRTSRNFLREKYGI